MIHLPFLFLLIWQIPALGRESTKERHPFLHVYLYSVVKLIWLEAAMAALNAGNLQSIHENRFSKITMMHLRVMLKVMVGCIDTIHVWMLKN